MDNRILWYSPEVSHKGAYFGQNQAIVKQEMVLRQQSFSSPADPT